MTNTAPAKAADARKAAAEMLADPRRAKVGLTAGQRYALKVAKTKDGRVANKPAAQPN
ncbi:hypothetical protein [Nocardioides dongkuii]|uniref:hypothetical protein n=1 Tax=Nocardioides dongkuii TaxID=2760089 RepID=UPI001878C07C|nr:hypothetical protein [Nocardioides dongkuii]